MLTVRVGRVDYVCYIIHSRIVIFIKNFEKIHRFQFFTFSA